MISKMRDEVLAGLFPVDLSGQAPFVRAALFVPEGGEVCCCVTGVLSASSNEHTGSQNGSVEACNALHVFSLLGYVT